MATKLPDVDVAIIGAGISGIGMAAHMQMSCPGRSYAIFERRAQLGGTWDLFRYPGIRSDSDMHTLGFAFEPWVHEKSIADGPSILEYLDKIVDERGIRPHIRLDNKVVSADFHSDDACWHIVAETPAGRQETTARFLYLGSGYYDYDQPFDAAFPGREDFQGQVVHPQFWPQDLDYAGKRVVVIGSGATAVTVVPAMAAKAAHVTMLQRTPTWMIARPARDAIANFLRRILPGETAYRLTRMKNIWFQRMLFKRAKTKPGKVADFLTKETRKLLGDKYTERDFKPPYDPWDQRLCLVPDEDFFAAIREGRASVVTDHIERFDATGIQLKSGQHIDADIIVTATGLSLSFGGHVRYSIDGQEMDKTQHWFYRGCMFSNVPNFAMTFGYLNASWTLRVDNNADYLCKVLNLMEAKGADIVLPYLPDDNALEEVDLFDFSSGYLQRGKHLVPKSAATLPWRLNQNYKEDCEDFRTRPIDDGILRFEHAHPAQLAQAAE
ncbi:MAG: NAD(P)/FAD-dependent oxidoreductase [Sphingomonadales bacterium]|nr:NAD(P)/FAD-dependent oxidoreductase [Sphingomonadales bacterium]MBD3772021.1 NAD(P)/FAD-dependent oxidoreductase [Paracoccaceae bacterium]